MKCCRGSSGASSSRILTEADSKSQELAAKLTEAQKSREQVKERDAKYFKLDSKLNRLHKRAKQRFQKFQKLILIIFFRRKMTLRLSIVKSTKSKSRLRCSCQNYNKSLIAHANMLMRHSKQSILRDNNCEVQTIGT
ncbi:uncharacterized protein [Rutidosis leptorrhynchoides]|uniref:uncharacterized protein n=1 Tax=Rutidosis leptorrhynchoides TaxID=125765 RepID=UPI003A995353